jgi:hypothetical protein
MNINKLLSKNTWKGKEVGKAVLITMINLNKPNADPKPLLSKEDFEKMVKGLVNEHERNIYYRYVDLNNAIVGMSLMIEAYIQQFYHGYYKYLFKLNSLLESWKLIEAYPIIMTEKQYQDYYSKAQREIKERKAQLSGLHKQKGIAILKEGSYSENDIDENGFYIDPCKQDLLKKITNINPVQIVESKETLLITGLRFILAYNKIMDIFAEVYATPELVELKKDEENFKTLLKVYNDASMSLSAYIEDNKLKETFSTIDLEELRPSEEAINQIKAKITKQGISGILSSRMKENNIYNYILELAGISTGGNK